MAVNGWVYVISNKAMPGLVKIGFSLKDPALRAQELAGTGSPHPYEVDYSVLIENPREVEQRAHRHLSALRVGKEWFRCAVTQAVAAIKTVAPTPLLFEMPHKDIGLRQGRAERPSDEPTSGGSDANHGVPCRPTGTYAGTCSHCGNHFSSTLYPKDREVKCPECLHLNVASRFVRHEITI